MALLTLVRHGQASFLADDYDRLSETGARQAHELGEYWARAGVLFDQVYFGPARRHIQTGEIVLQRCRKAGLPWPDPLPLPEAQEYSGIEVMRAFLPGLMEKHEEIREMEARYRTAGDRTAAGRLYDVLFQRITTMWVAGELDSPSVESWAAFCERVSTGIARVREATGRGARVAVFTSGGVIAATVREALDLSPQKTLELSWTSPNASISEFLFSIARFSLSSFNALPHIQDRALITYR